MKLIIEKLNRYKFTLIYGAGFWYLGGAVLCVPAILITMIIDFSITRKYLKIKDEKIRTVLAGSLFVFFFVVIIYTITIKFGFDRRDGEGLINSWLAWTSAFTDIMASYVPAIDRISGQMEGLSPRIAANAPVFRHLYSVYWFVGIIIAPTFLLETFRWVEAIIRNDFYVKQGSFGMSYKESQEKQKQGWTPPIDNTKKFFLVISLSSFYIIGCIWASFYFWEWAYYFPEDFSIYMYNRGRYLQLPFVALVIPFCTLWFIVLSFFGSILFVKRRKYLSTQKNSKSSLLE